MINVFGPRPRASGGPPEQQLGHGFAGLPLDNVGVQYGLEALKKGQITPAQFVDLNAKIGGADIDINHTAARFGGRPSRRSRNAYRSGAINETNNLDERRDHRPARPRPGRVPRRLPLVGDPRPARARAGHFPHNQVIWFGAAPLIGDPQLRDRGPGRDGPLAGRGRGGRQRHGSLAQKIADDRPSDVHDRCSQVDGVEQVDVPGVGTVCELDAVQTRFGTPRTVAGEGDRDRHEQVPAEAAAAQPTTTRSAFTDDQWAALAEGVPDRRLRLEQARRRPAGRRSRGRPTRTRTGDVIYGGAPLGAAPAGSGGGWTSPAFSSWRESPGAERPGQAAGQRARTAADRRPLRAPGRACRPGGGPLAAALRQRARGPGPARGSQGPARRVPRPGAGHGLPGRACGWRRRTCTDPGAVERHSTRVGGWSCSWRGAGVAQQVLVSCRRRAARISFVDKIPSG